MRKTVLILSILFLSHGYADCVGHPIYPGAIFPEYEIQKMGNLNNYWEACSKQFPNAVVVKRPNSQYVKSILQYCLITTQLKNHNLHPLLQETETFVLLAPCETIEIGQNMNLLPACRDSLVSFGPEPPFFNWLDKKLMQKINGTEN